MRRLKNYNLVQLFLVITAVAMLCTAVHRNRAEAPAALLQRERGNFSRWKADRHGRLPMGT